MDFKQIVAKERSEKAERVKKETDGGQIIFYLGEGFSVFMSMIFGFDMDRSDEPFPSFIIWAIGLSVLIYFGFNKYLYYCKENGKPNNNIFVKYNYIPVDMRKLFWAKAFIAGRNILGVALLGQMLALFIVIVNPGNEGAAVTDLYVWIPLMVGVIALMLFLLNMAAVCRKGIAEKIVTNIKKIWLWLEGP